MSPQNQTALAMTAVGKPLSQITRPIPTPKSNEVLLKITACGLIPLDMKYLTLGIYNIGSRLPAVLGADIVGEVVEVGDAVTHLSRGQHVLSQSSMRDVTSGGLQQYTALEARLCVPVPKELSDLEASTVPVNAFTAGVSLFGEAGLGIPLPGSERSSTFDYAAATLLVIGGGSNVGQFAVQFARVCGVGRIVVLGSDVQALKSLGATHVVDRKLEPEAIRKQIRDVVGDDLLYIFDSATTGDASFPISLLSSHKKGTYVHVTMAELKDPAAVEGLKAGYEKKRVLGATAMHSEFSDVFWKAFGAWVEKGEVKPARFEVVEGLDTAKVNEAFDMLAKGTMKGGKWAVKL